MNNKMSAVFTVVDYSKGGKIAALFEKEKLPFHVSTHGHGSADSELLDYLGFGENKKNVTISLMTRNRAKHIFAEAEEKLLLKNPGSGIIFSVPVSSMTAFIAGLAEHDDAKNKKTEEGKEVTAEYEYELIVTIVTKGYFPEVKAAANAAGARGGTMLHAHGLGGEEAMKFLGIAIQPEKDIILIVVRREQKNSVMKAIAEAAGINTEGKGIIFSLPVDSASGLSERRRGAPAGDASTLHIY